MIWAYLLIALAVVAGGVTAVETYRSAIHTSAVAEDRANAEAARARQAERSTKDLQELVDYGDTLAKNLQEDVAARDDAIRKMEARIRDAAKRDPKAFVCEGTPVPADIRELRHATFAAEPAGGVLHPPNAAAPDAATAPAGRDVRGPEAGGGRDPEGARAVQPGEAGRAPAAGEAKPAALRDRIKALMGRSKGTP